MLGKEVNLNRAGGDDGGSSGQVGVADILL